MIDTFSRREHAEQGVPGLVEGVRRFSSGVSMTRRAENDLLERLAVVGSPDLGLAAAGGAQRGLIDGILQVRTDHARC
jgi:hypothetical protein